TKAAKFGAGDFILAGTIDADFERNLHPRHDVLLGAEFADEEIVDNVPGMKQEEDIAPDWHSKRGGDKIVVSVRIRRIETDGIAARIADEFVVRTSEDSVGAGIAEMPCELARVDFEARLARRFFGDSGPAARAQSRKTEE